MGEYQKKRKNPYLLPRDLYMRTLYIIRDYERLKSVAENIAEQETIQGIEWLHKVIKNSLTGVVNASAIDRMVSLIASRLLETGVVLPLEKQTDSDVVLEVEAIEKAMETIPEFFREPVYNNILSGDRYPVGADERTFQRYKQQFIYFVARNLGKI